MLVVDRGISERAPIFEGGIDRVAYFYPARETVIDNDTGDRVDFIVNCMSKRGDRIGPAAVISEQCSLEGYESGTLVTGVMNEEIVYEHFISDSRFLSVIRKGIARKRAISEIKECLVDVLAFPLKSSKD